MAATNSAHQAAPSAGDLAERAAARSRNDSIRRNPTAASSSASKLNSTCER